MASSRDRDEVRANLDRLKHYLERHYNTHIVGLTRLDRGVYRVDRQEGRSWVARIFPAERKVDKVEGDADVLRFLEEHGFPAERCANSDPVSAPGGRGVLLTEFVRGPGAESEGPTLRAFGEMLGRLNAMAVGSGRVAREAGSLHRYSPIGGGPRNYLDAAVSWLDAVKDKVPVKNRPPYESLCEQIAQVDDCNDLPKALIHPDPVLKNLISEPNSGLLLIDWTGAGRGPRLVSLAVLLWSGALRKGGWSPQNVDAVAAGYRSQVHLEKDGLARLAGAMRIRPLVFACWRYRHAMLSEQPPNGKEWWWPSDGLIEAVAARGREASGS